MISIDNVEVNGLEAAIRSMRNPLNSWDKSDSKWEWIRELCFEYRIGDNDIKLAQKLIKAGTDESKFLRFITVDLDVEAPIYWWKEFDTYKVGTVRNSCSTMHKIHSKPIETADFSIDDYTNLELIDPTGNINILFEMTINNCEQIRQLYTKTKDKRYWRALIQMLPESYNQLSTIHLNYQVLRNMYSSRKNHKLQEWRNFCEFIEKELPYGKELICYKGE